MVVDELRTMNSPLNKSVKCCVNLFKLENFAAKCIQSTKPQANRMWAGLVEVSVLNIIKYVELINFIWHHLCANVCAMKNRLCKLIPIEHFPAMSAFIYRLTNKFTKNDTLKTVKWNANELNVTHISRAYANWKTDNCTQVHSHTQHRVMCSMLILPHDYSDVVRVASARFAHTLLRISIQSYAVN